MSYETLQFLWFILFMLLIVVYAILDGFDLGIGFWSLFEKDPIRRAQHMDVIAPVWDGNEVWLLTGGGALFAAFPLVYSTVFSGFYIAMMLLLAALMFRAVSFEFRNKVESHRWQRFWDLAFGIGSIIPPVLYGVAVGNILQGVPIEKVSEGYMWRGSFIGLLNPFSILIGSLTLAMFATHGAIYLAYKAEGELAEKSSKRITISYGIWLILWVVAIFSARFFAPHLMDQANSKIIGWIFLICSICSFVSIPLLNRMSKYGFGFLGSSLAIASTTALGAVGLYPRLVPSSIDLAGASLTIHNASSSERTLQTMLIIAAIGMPIVIAYTIFIYRVFKGKIRSGEFYNIH